MDWNKWEKEFNEKMAKVAEKCNNANISQIANTSVTTSNGKTYVNGKEYDIPKNAHSVSIVNGVVKVNGKRISPIIDEKPESIDEFKMNNCGPMDPLNEDNDLLLTNLYFRKYNKGHVYKKDDKLYYSSDGDINPIDITASDTIATDIEEQNRDVFDYNVADYVNIADLSKDEYGYYNRLCENIIGKKLFDDNKHTEETMLLNDNSRFPADACMFDLDGKPNDEELFKGVTYKGHKLPKCPGMIVNSSGEITNIKETKDSLFCNGYQFINGSWKKTFKAKIKNLFNK